MAAPAAAEIKTVVKRTGPFELDPYQVRYTDRTSKDVPAPGISGHIVRMHARVVDKAGRPLPVRKLMLHHVVYKNRGLHEGDRKDAVCGGRAESFYGTGEENLPMQFPPNYGYRIFKGEKWTMGWMLMNHQNRKHKAYIEYRATIDTRMDMGHVTPYWLRSTGCKNAKDPIFDVPGGGAPGSRHYVAATWRLPRSGLLIAAGGHAHGGSHDLTLTQPACGERPLLVSKPTYGMPDHPYYNVLPVLHEPGPINMSWTQTGVGIPLGGGETIRTVADYDAQFPHVRAMGIMHVYVHHKDGIERNCDPLPDDIIQVGTNTPGRRTPPPVKVPLTGLDADGNARTISGPPGRVRRFNGDVSINVRDFSYGAMRKLSVPLGAKVRWRFIDRQSHNVTMANGPFGFSAQNLNRGKSYARRFTKPGVYQNFCSLHPVDMTQKLIVRRNK
jgi:plastocyanin